MKRFAFALTALLAACGGGSSTPAVPASSASASPSPSPSATAASVAISPTSLSFASGTAQNLAVSESGYSGTFTESDTCNPYGGEIVAVVASSDGTGAATYAVTPIGAGTCTITVTDAAGRAAGVNVTVSTAAITVQ